MVHIDIPGYEKKLYVPDTLAANLQKCKIAVNARGWDYVCIVSGIPGVGKSTFAQVLAKFFDPNFESWQICFTAEEFKEKTSNGNKGQAFILDESFADLNSSLSRSPEFVALVNHLQLIRQKNLFLILVLPDFFSLAKNIALFRSSHLFVPYSVEYKHGDVAVFDREAKRQLYIKGKPFVDYQAAPPNFRCDFQGHWFCDVEDYKKRKDEHLKSMSKVKEVSKRATQTRDVLAFLLHERAKVTIKEISEMVKLPFDTVANWIPKGRQRYDLLHQPNSVG